MAQFVGGRYQLIAQLGGGGMADVYLAKMIGKSDFAKLAVVKRLKVNDAEDSDVAKMFSDEARLSARLNHPNIVQTFEVGEDTEGPYLVMEYLEGQPLSRLRSRSRRRGTPLPRTIGLHVLKEALTALSYAHQLCDHDGEPLRVVHRDVSPENVLVTYAGTTKLVDFGVAKTVNSSTHTRAGVLKGKIAYMAPEQARSESLDARADVFAAGLILWEVLAGKRMWEGMTELDVVARLVDTEPLPSLTSIDADIPEELAQVCVRALHKERDDRYESAADMLEELEKIQRKLDLHATAREVSQLVSGYFEDEREKMKKVVSAAVSRATGPAGEGDASLPHLSARSSRTSDLAGPDSDASVWNTINGGGPIPTPSTPLVAPLSTKSNATEVSTPATTTPSIPSPAPAPPRKSKAVPLIGALIVAAAIGIGFKVYTAGHVQPTPEPVQAKQSPTAPPTEAQTAPLPTPSANVTPPPAPEVTVDITAKPAAARIFVDGKRAPGNPHRITAARGDTSHEIRAEADGYEPRSVTVAFDRDRALDLTLVGKGATPPPVVMGTPVKTVPHGVKGTATSLPATTAAPPPTTATPPPAPTPTARGISEIDPTKSSTQPKQDTIDKDVFKK